MWAEGVHLPADLREGDLLALPNAGGRAQAMASDHRMRGGAPEPLLWSARRAVADCGGSAVGLCVPRSLSLPGAGRAYSQSTGAGTLSQPQVSFRPAKVASDALQSSQLSSVAQPHCVSVLTPSLSVHPSVHAST